MVLLISTSCRPVAEERTGAFIAFALPRCISRRISVSPKVISAAESKLIASCSVFTVYDHPAVFSRFAETDSIEDMTEDLPISIRRCNVDLISLFEYSPQVAQRHILNIAIKDMARTAHLAAIFWRSVLWPQKISVTIEAVPFHFVSHRSSFVLALISDRFTIRPALQRVSAFTL